MQNESEAQGQGTGLQKIKAKDLRKAVPVDQGLPVFLEDNWEAHVSMWIQLREEVTDRQWKMGAVAYSVVKVFGDGSLKKFAESVGEREQTLKQYVDIYERYSTHRLEPLIYSHYRVAANFKLPPAALEEAATSGWSAAQFEREARKLQAKDHVESPVKEDAFYSAEADWRQLEPRLRKFSAAYPQHSEEIERCRALVTEAVYEPWESGVRYVGRLMSEGLLSVTELIERTRWSEETVEMLRAGAAERNEKEAPGWWAK